MGNWLGCLEFVSYANQWIDDEDATFYIPESVPLTARQTSKLQQLGVSQGEAFVISKTGTLAKPAAKLYTVQANTRLFALCSDAIDLFEDFPGQFSIEFDYYLPEGVTAEVEICFHCKNTSDSHFISVAPCNNMPLCSWGKHSLASIVHGETDGNHSKTHKWSSRPLGLYAEHYHLISLSSQRTSNDALVYDCAFLLTVTDMRAGHAQRGDVLQEGLFFRINKDRTAIGSSPRVLTLAGDGVRADVDTGSQSPDRGSASSQYPPLHRSSAAPIQATCIDHLFLVEYRQGKGADTIAGSRVYSKITLFGSSQQAPSSEGDGHGAAAGDDDDDDDGPVASPPSEDHLCVICLSSQRDTVVFPCRHLCLCGTCSSSLSTGSRHMKKCPVCRVHIVCMLQLKQ